MYFFLSFVANFNIPKVGDIYAEINFTDIYGIAAEKIVRQYREDALGLPSYPQSKRGRYEPRDGYRGGWNSSPRGGGGYSPRSYKWVVHTVIKSALNYHKSFIINCVKFVIEMEK